MKDAYKVFTVGLEDEIEAASFQDAAQKGIRTWNAKNLAC